MATTPLRNTTIFNISPKAEFIEPIVWDGKFGCPLCSFEGKDEGDLKKHYQSEEHHETYVSACKSPASTSSFYDIGSDETEREYTKRTSLAYNLGVLPSYLLVTEKYGTLWFSHGLRKANKNSLSSREKRGEVGLLSPQQYAQKQEFTHRRKRPIKTCRWNFIIEPKADERTICMFLSVSFYDV
ncbi:hypothetical protein PMV_038 [Port-miou virus]|uniref:Uncharacterized protein n=1 Tax=Port-miou virus TaxID=1733873 RepID=A0A0N7G2C4_9VIRU|nr:hypothetical protein PMV_038 [Port-miou virus]